MLLLTSVILCLLFCLLKEFIWVNHIYLTWFLKEVIWVTQSNLTWVRSNMRKPLMFQMEEGVTLYIECNIYLLQEYLKNLQINMVYYLVLYSIDFVIELGCPVLGDKLHQYITYVLLGLPIKLHTLILR